MQKKMQELEENLAQFQKQLKQLQFEKDQLRNNTTSQNIALESARPELEQNHNAPAIAETSSEAMPDFTDHRALTDCQPTLLPVIARQFAISEESIEEEEIALNDELSHLNRFEISDSKRVRECNKILFLS
ncbi:hypothetical protein Ddc_20964 [Ditylenchus destructor]|nr:hypothetical protein Ddc_20964 [Ditylenchus destructor]